jgi:hypothetical protein
MAIIHRKLYEKLQSSLERFSQIWLQTRNQVKIIIIKCTIHQTLFLFGEISPVKKERLKGHTMHMGMAYNIAHSQSTPT